MSATRDLRRALGGRAPVDGILGAIGDTPLVAQGQFFADVLSTDDWVARIGS